LLQELLIKINYIYFGNFENLFLQFFFIKLLPSLRGLEFWKTSITNNFSLNINTCCFLYNFYAICTSEIANLLPGDHLLFKYFKLFKFILKGCKLYKIFDFHLLAFIKFELPKLFPRFFKFLFLLKTLKCCVLRSVFVLARKASKAEILINKEFETFIFAFIAF